MITFRLVQMQSTGVYMAIWVDAERMTMKVRFWRI